MARFEGIDFCDIDALLPEEERMIRDTVRDWVEDRVMPLIGEAYIQRRFPKELIPEMGDSGIRSFGSVMAPSPVRRCPYRPTTVVCLLDACGRTGSGTPSARNRAVGEPGISSWAYDL